ncbi:MAG: hypothetical protein QGG42_06380 [Phycisphaerae bacterium]|jgi:hypothetical protein|nr:hypothetical protein [Phycisphaerae bacterium]
MMYWLGKLLGIDGLESVVEHHIQFAAPWAHGRPALVLFACVAVSVLSMVFYIRYQGLKKKRASVSMAIFRAILLSMLVWILAEPEVALKIKQNPKPLLLMLFDGTDSMNMKDGVSDNTQTALKTALGDATPNFGDGDNRPSRQDIVQATLRSKKLGWLNKLNKKFRLRGYVLDQTDRVREFDMPQLESGEIDVEAVAGELEGANANVTALGAALEDISRRTRSRLLAGVVVVSDFDQNRGRPLVAAGERLNAPVYTVGVGPLQATNLSVGLQAPMVLKKGEKTSVTVLLRHSGLEGQPAEVELLARRLGTIEGVADSERFERVAPTKVVNLDSKSVTAEIVYQPQVTGRFTLQAKVTPLEGEVLSNDNSSQRDVMIRDESLKLLFVEHEPTWEWRFMKEVFHRHPMIGREGFRTYLDSADFSVRRGNDLFIETLVRSREEFFSYDIIFISDVPGRTLSPHFQKMLKEYVLQFGGGLVVLAGPRNGPSSLLRTSVADMLPIVPGSGIRVRHGQFSLGLTPEAKEYDFMRLGDSDFENEQAWSCFRKLQWYQPSVRPHPLATVLAEHPRDRCVDAKTPQPLIAVRRYGKGEVVYFAFNETWRLRRLYGEKYYSQLWGQLIYRMGLSRALGSQKRFRVETDRDVYQAGQKVRVTVEAYNRDYQPLELKTGSLSAKLIAPQATGDSQPSQTTVSIPLSRDKVIYETSVPVFASGLHRLLVKDPITLDEVETTFKVSPTTAEGRSAVRNITKQRRLAEDTGGKSYELHEVATMADDVKDRDVEEYSNRRIPLWNTWLVLVLGLTLMLGEWLTRKLMNLQ